MTFSPTQGYPPAVAKRNRPLFHVRLISREVRIPSAAEKTSPSPAFSDRHIVRGLTHDELNTPHDDLRRQTYDAKVDNIEHVAQISAHPALIWLPLALEPVFAP